MSKNKIIKILSICFLIVVFLYNMSCSAFAARSIDEIVEGADNFIDNAKTSKTIDEGSLQDSIDITYNVFLAIGLIAAVVAGLILGIQFMMGATEEKANVKEKLIPYTVGCVVIFGAFGIWKIVITLLGKV